MYDYVQNTRAMDWIFLFFYLFIFSFEPSGVFFVFFFTARYVHMLKYIGCLRVAFIRVSFVPSFIRDSFRTRRRCVFGNRHHTCRRRYDNTKITTFIYTVACPYVYGHIRVLNACLPWRFSQYLQYIVRSTNAA